MSSGDYDYKVKVVDDAGQADWSVFAVDGIADLSPSVGDVLVWDGTAWVDLSLAAAGIQPLDADLTAIAALTTAAYGRSLLTLANLAALKAALALASTDLSDFGTVTATTQTDSYTLALVDKGTVVAMDKATAVTLTIPTDATIPLPIGTVIEIYQKGAGQVTVAAAGGVTLRAPRGAKLAAQYTTASLRKRAADEWVLSGDTTT